jgi:hypothetical protein
MALGWLLGAYRLPTKWLCGGLRVALGGFAHRPSARSKTRVSQARLLVRAQPKLDGTVAGEPPCFSGNHPRRSSASSGLTPPPFLSRILHNAEQNEQH